MCGVGGIYTPVGMGIDGYHEEILERIGTDLHLRGPDAFGKIIGDSFGLIHTRLAIIDLDSRSNQPMESNDWVLSYNGEIYNFKSIRKDLQSTQIFRTESDTEVLLMALQEWGIEKTLQRIAGMFAFLAYNKKENILYAARDHMGIKPLLMTRLEDGSYCFASSTAALIKSQKGLSRSIYKPALASYFVLGAPFTRNTVFEGIERVEPATYVKCLPNGRFTTHRYWEPRYQSGFTMDDLISIVTEYEVSDVQSALFLSGGVDSTFLASITQKLDCFHLISPETHYAKEVADRFSRKFVSVKPSLSNYETNIRRVIEFHGEPLMSCGIPYSVSEEITKHGYKMAISANGADELFHGYPRTPTPEHTPDYLPLHEEKTYKWFSMQLSHIFRDNRNFEIEELKEFVPSLNDIGNDAMDKFHLSNFPPSASHRWFELMTYVLHDLNPTLDAASMANSIEVRVPFLDHRLVEGVLSWDASVLVTPSLGRKAPLKEHLSRYFPVSFFHRPKLGFSIHQDSLARISKLGEKALNRSEKNNFIKLDNSSKLGEYLRDMIYLGTTCYSYETWRNSNLFKTGQAS
ncbi:MAG: asparagine synthase (glutamine-hydrolyzing) [Gammaproteobacteria bacterium]|nr:asparagine synthase (glutamine-hydrolyzing) [Gammaproteobacteria bacterium]